MTNSNRKPARFSVELPTRGGTITGWRWASAGSPDRLVFSHANGFNGGTYRQFLSALTFPGEIIAIDQRGHGETTLPADPCGLRSWYIYADDACALLDALPATGGRLFLAGHSFGAVVAILTAARSPQSVMGVALADPVVLSSVQHRFLRLMAWSPFQQQITKRLRIVRRAQSRRAEFQDRETAFERYVSKSPFASWHEGVLADYLEDGLVSASPDGVKLACAPAWEAANFAAQGHNVWAGYKAMRAKGVPPPQLLLAERGSTTHGSAQAQFRKDGAVVTIVEDSSHLMLMEKPHHCASLLKW